jgi:HK97 family phage major capsid protein
MMLKAQSIFQKDTMSRLAELRHESDQISARTKAMLEQYPGNKWGGTQESEWAGLMARAGEVHAEITSLRAANEQAGRDWTNEDGGRVKVLRNAADFRAHYANMQGGAPRNGEQIQISDFLRGVAGMKTTAGVSAALSVGTDSSGGFAVPSLVMPQILEALVPASSLLSAGAGIVPLSEGAKQYTTAAVDNIPTAAWRLESGNLAESAPTFRAVVAAPKSLAFYFKASRELLADASNMDAALNVAIAQAFAKELDRAGLRGTGTNPEPRGILNTVGIKTVSNGVNGAALAGYGNFFSGAQELLSANAPMPTAAIMSPRSLVKLGALSDSTGQPLRRPEMLSGMTMLSTSAVPNNLTVGTSTDCSEIYIGDFTKLAFMMREQVSIQVAKEVFATTGEIGFVCHVRADVVLTHPACFAVVTGVRA